MTLTSLGVERADADDDIVLLIRATEDLVRRLVDQRDRSMRIEGGYHTWTNTMCIAGNVISEHDDPCEAEDESADICSAGRLHILDVLPKILSKPSRHSSIDSIDEVREEGRRWIVRGWSSFVAINVFEVLPNQLPYTTAIRSFSKGVR